MKTTDDKAVTMNQFNPETICGIQYQRPNAGGASGGASPDTDITLWDDNSKTVFSATVREIAELVNDKARLDWLEQFITFEPIHVAPEDTEYGAHVTGKFFTSLRLRAVRQKDATLRAAIDANQHLSPTPSPNR